jgi:2'-5' RNA ligase
MRTFIAIDLEPPLKRNLEALISELKPLGMSTRWVKAEGMHLTLKFLGEIPDQKAGSISNALEAIVGAHPSFPLRLKGTGYFPPGRRDPRVVWVGVESDSGLSVLQTEIDAAMEKLGFEREKRDFHPHLTLGRVKSPGGLGPLLQELDQHKGDEFGEMTVTRVTFFRSTLRPAGAEYSVIAEFRLG